MDFQIYVHPSKPGLKENVNSLKCLDRPSIAVEVNSNVEDVWSNFKEFDFEIANEAPDYVSTAGGCEFFKFLADKEYVENIYFIITERKTTQFCKFLENACEVWKNESDRLSDEVLNLLNKTFISTLHNTTHNQLHCGELTEYLIQQNESDLLKSICDAGFDPNIEKFISRIDHESIEFITQQTDLSKEFLHSKSYFHLATFCYRCFPETFPKLKQIVLTLSLLYPGAELKTALSQSHQEYGHKNPVEYAIQMQADQMLDVFWNIEHAFKTSMNQNTWTFDVTDMIPDTVWRRKDEGDIEMKRVECQDPLTEVRSNKEISFLERIIASSVSGDRRAAKMIALEPMRHLVHDYVIWSKFSRAVLFCIQVLFMTLFTWHTFNHVNPHFAALETCYTPPNKSNSSDLSNLPKSCTEAREHLPSVTSALLFLIWPLVAFAFTMVQLVGLCKLIKGAGVGVGLKTMRLYFSYFDFTLLICFCLWFLCLSSSILNQSYFELIATIMIIGWMRPTFYLSYTSYLSAFSVALKSSMIKYIVSFIFMFTFVFIGFSLAFKNLLTKHSYAELDKPIDKIAYISFVTLFGMGELDQVPENMGDDVGALIFLKFVICMYCSCTAILILAMIRQPDEELVARVGSELKSRINLKFLKDISWLVVLRKRFKCSFLQEDMYGSLSYELKTFFGFEPRSYRKLKDRYDLVILKEADTEEDEVRKGNEVNENIESLQLQLASVQKVLAEINTRLKSPK